MDIINLDSWAERINNLLKVQKEEQIELITTRFTRTELVELRVIINTLDDLVGEKTK